MQKSLFKDRKWVEIKRDFSQWLRVIDRVPDRSVLGPLLFNVKINDPEEMVSSKMIASRQCYTL